MSRKLQLFLSHSGRNTEAAQQLRERILAAWNGEEGDGEGDTSDLINQARAADLEITGIEP